MTPATSSFCIIMNSLFWLPRCMNCQELLCNNCHTESNDHIMACESRDYPTNISGTTFIDERGVVVQKGDKSNFNLC